MNLKGINPSKEDKKKDNPSRKVSDGLKKSTVENKVKPSVIEKLEINKTITDAPKEIKKKLQKSR